MFESMVYIRKEQSLARRLLSFPLAITFHALLALTFVAYSLFVHEALPPPTLMLSGVPDVAIPVAFVQRREGAVRKNDGSTAPSQDRALQAPGEVPSEIKAASNEPPADSGPTGPEPPPGWIFSDHPGIVSGPPADPQPARRVLQSWEMVKVPQLVRRVEPAYPPAAAAMRQEGKVILQVVVDERGMVESMQVLSSTSSLFDQAALDAVRRWEYTPPVAQGGQSVACTMTVVVTFALR